jgi:hypothetical protein
VTYTVDADERIDIVELDKDRWITLEFAREWPKYVVTWSVRRRVGDGDFPEQRGRVEQMPPRDGETLEDVQGRLRDMAVGAAQEAASQAPQSGETERPSFLKRLLGRD